MIERKMIDDERWLFIDWLYFYPTQSPKGSDDTERERWQIKRQRMYNILNRKTEGRKSLPLIYFPMTPYVPPSVQTIHCQYASGRLSSSGTLQFSLTGKWSPTGGGRVLQARRWPISALHPSWLINQIFKTAAGWPAITQAAFTFGKEAKVSLQLKETPEEAARNPPPQAGFSFPSLWHRWPNKPSFC